MFAFCAPSHVIPTVVCASVPSVGRGRMQVVEGTNRMGLWHAHNYMVIIVVVLVVAVIVVVGISASSRTLWIAPPTNMSSVCGFFEIDTGPDRAHRYSSHIHSRGSRLREQTDWAYV